MAKATVTVVIPAELSGNRRERATDRAITEYDGQRGVWFYRRFYAVEPYPATSRYYGWYRATAVLVGPDEHNVQPALASSSEEG